MIHRVYKNVSKTITDDYFCLKNKIVCVKNLVLKKIITPRERH